MNEGANRAVPESIDPVFEEEQTACSLISRMKNNFLSSLAKRNGAEAAFRPISIQHRGECCFGSVGEFPRYKKGQFSLCMKGVRDCPRVTYFLLSRSLFSSSINVLMSLNWR